MRVRGLVLYLGVAACDHVLQLDPIRTPDARPDSKTACPASTTLPDEDGDGCPNVGDDCPGIADPAQADMDGDGVGDACDPHPIDPFDSLFAAAYFDNGPDPAWLLDNPGDWTTGTGEITNSGTIAVNLTHASMPVYPGIEIGYHANMTGELRIELRGPSKYIYCHADWNPNEYDLFLDSTTSGPSSANSDLRIGLHADTGGASCNLLGQPIADAANPALQVPLDATILVEGNEIASIRYILIYQYTPP